ncbi:ASCH domain-containing protein [Leptospira sp. 201903074]|uniref:ASCH domain-containing protein n=1 Tax=Leptospira abararensis TaxID=2810036 RepID=UPI0019624894|nr:ASCH domain-containing protein [Leptospira abararensis]MBM9546109.1 ASCH domain-containing protein [Leptospira abararensis]
MKCLSIRQPWAEAIVLGLKPLENRDWYTNVRGEIFIHAGRTFDKDGLAFLQKEFRLFLGKTESDFLLGGLVGKTEIVDCIKKSTSKWFFGKWAFVMKNSRKIEFVPYKGQLGFFEVSL